MADTQFFFHKKELYDYRHQPTGRNGRVFYPYDEGVDSGSEFLMWDIPNVGRFNISICYHVWFPETYCTMAVNGGVQVIIYPALTGKTLINVELPIVKATVAMNQCYMSDVNGLEAGGIGRSLFLWP